MRLKLAGFSSSRPSRIRKYALALLAIHALIGEAAVPEFPASDIVESFGDENEALQALQEFENSGEAVYITRANESLELQTLFLGPYKTQKRANEVARHLNENSIDTWIQTLAKGQYLVHAGAMEEEQYFLERHALMTRLGFQNIQTAVKTVERSKYLLVRKEKHLPPTQKNAGSNVRTAFVNGDISGWGQGKDATSANYLTAAIGEERSSAGGRWHIAYGFRAELLELSGSIQTQQSKFDYLPTYIEYQGAKTRFAAGAMQINWGSTDRFDSVLDRLSVHDFSFNTSDTAWQWRRRAALASLLEIRFGNFTLQAAAIPVFRPTQLPAAGSIWHPVQTANGEIEGLTVDSTLGTLAKNGVVGTDGNTSYGSAGLALTHNLKWARQLFTIQYSQAERPYYQINPQILASITQGLDVLSAIDLSTGPALLPVYPHSVLVGLQEAGKGWQFEAAMRSNVPVTRSDYTLSYANELLWQVQADFHPGLARTRATLNVQGRHLGSDETLLDHTSSIILGGRLMQYTPGKRWRYGSVYKVGLDHMELALTPYVRYAPNEHIHIRLDLFYFAGANGTWAGVRKNQSLASLSWAAAF